MSQDPNQEFVIDTVTRDSIAEILNSAAENDEIEGWVDLTPDDDRLTDEFCQAFADQCKCISEFAEEKADDETHVYRYQSNKHFVAVIRGEKDMGDWDISC